MKIITEEQAPQLTGTVEVIGTGNKLYCKSQAIALANNHAHEGTPLLCEYTEMTISNRTVKRYLPLIQKRKAN
jgi:hypothetical protein